LPLTSKAQFIKYLFYCYHISGYMTVASLQLSKLCSKTTNFAIALLLAGAKKAFAFRCCQEIPDQNLCGSMQSNTKLSEVCCKEFSRVSLSSKCYYTIRNHHVTTTKSFLNISQVMQLGSPSDCQPCCHRNGSVW